MLSNHVSHTDLSREDKLKAMQLISVHSYSPHSELLRAPFQTRLLAYTWSILTVVVSPTRIEEDMCHQRRWDWKALHPNPNPNPTCTSVTNPTRLLVNCHYGSASFPLHNLCTALGISQPTWISTRQQTLQRSMGLTGLLFLPRHMLQT